MNTEIFFPMFYLGALTVFVVLLSTALRLKEIYLDGTIQGEAFRHPPFKEGSRLLKNTQRNLTNLFEFPVLFYVVCICIFVTGKVDETFIFLGYWFFFLRVAHSAYHIFINQLIVAGGFPVRALIWIPSTAVLIWMWIRFISLV